MPKIILGVLGLLGAASLTGCVVYEPARPHYREVVVVSDCPPPPPPPVAVVVAPPPPVVGVWVGPEYHYHGWGRPYHHW
jgi:hypothetical protein